MSIVEDFNFYLMQGSAGSLKEVVKQTMLSQEVIFKKQVQELHRLHSMQKNLMEDFFWKDLNGYSFWKISTQSTFSQHSAMLEEKLFSTGPMESTDTISKEDSKSVLTPSDAVPIAGNSLNEGLKEQHGSSDLKSCSPDRDSQLSLLNEQDFSSELKKEDILILKAAESLVHFSFANYNQDCCSNGILNEHRDKPQHSLDSYESIVLKLTESSVDDYCVTSKPFEVNETNKKDFGVRLRRGRRLKDFQRDVLPTLSSLSIHEIREDVGIMEMVIRSREYKRMRSKMSSNGGGNWSAPVKRPRSRRNYARKMVRSV